MSIFEVIMLICFGAAWPSSILKSYRSRSNAGKSVSFLFIILIGYISGCFHKAFYSFDKVIYLYFLNATMVTIDIVIYYRNEKIMEYPTGNSTSQGDAC